MKDITVFWRFLASIGILGLVTTIIVWNGWLTPVQGFPRSIKIIILVGPLLYFVRGVLHGQRDTYIAVMLLSFLYVLYGIWYVFSPQEALYGYSVFVFSLSLFFGALLNVWILDKRDKKNNGDNSAES